ncbi:CPBP family intramembrane metalloprotease [Tsukamurella sp. 8F]|uniref:CPBP family intramembrane glutamic endopeptidase n=1 Tax=unclassified Tsukamurella TaxID=2633480 RepID=UPI0023B9BE82|nr:MULTISPECIES: CPBP family intramembrane glutamic endopeptidase [unclassified Tsukamurella]MDF0530818.1 CPBP family intramembrane metalloprotease [Tsukamurella sp. 8J]MDF0589528.1 CPBP family intramembrane metalloprotease [Tsukamurella sp. 8F]
MTGDRDRLQLRVEVAVVLLVTFGWSGLYALTQLVGYQLGAGVGATTVALNPVRSKLPVIDFTLMLLNALQLFAWAALALYLLRRSGITAAALGLGRLDGRGAARAALYGIGLAAAVGLPGLGLYALGRLLGVTANVEAASGGVPWWRIVAYLVVAVANAAAEEVVVVGYLTTRLQQLGRGAAATVLLSALLRGSYHLYQGFGAGLGNVVMGLVFGAAYLRWRKLWPLVVAHAVMDVTVYVGYAVLAPHLGVLS